MMLLVYGLSELGNGNVSLTTIGAFAAAALALVAFVLIERRSVAPVLHLGFLKRNVIFVSNFAALLTFATTVPMVFFLATYLQVVKGYSPIIAAAGLVPGSLTFFSLGGFGAPRLVSRFGFKSVIAVAMVLLSAGMFLMSFFTAGSSYVTVVAPVMILASSGGALTMTATNIAALSGAVRGEEGVASGLINTSRQVGGPIGLAVVITVMGLLGGSQGAGGIQFAFATSAAFGALGFLGSLFLKKVPVIKAGEVRGGEPEGAGVPVVE